ncbi:FAD/NAD(P)-binding domain-containing protein [Byssothecium circinans]|uniref:FAD/NAD(P)-binding domain-containing protein n=1 Tax=Byssothecium circinans TaxID=147558 RepID=A0A6A5T8V3_9PLEO|nr:FAD/NAD(P)-binding domain-containing protein [Byssothecium circinans]
MKTCISLTIPLGALALALSTRDQFDTESYAAKDVLTRDVAVIGGGATGIYGAVNLHSRGKSVIVVEKEHVLGGHTNTYIDPATGVSVDYGVQALWNITVTQDYFKLLGITPGPLQFLPLTRFYANFQTGKEVSGVRSTFNFSPYKEQLDKYPYLLYTWKLPKPVPEDLLLTFADFLKKYNLADTAYDVYFSAGGVSNILDQLTINVFKFIDESFLDSITGNAIVPSTNNFEIYAKAATLLGKDVLLESTVVASRRSDNSVALVVQTPSGKKLIKASKLLISIPPLLENVRPFDLDNTETSLFSKWSYTDYYTLLVNNTGLPTNFQYANANESSTTYNIPQLPAPYFITPTRIPGLFYSWYASPSRVTEQQVKSDVSAIIKRLRQTVNSTTEGEPTFVEFRSHTPFKLVVGKEEIEGGFYDKLEGLQGKRSTYWTGAAFMSHDAAVLWNYTQALLPGLAA